MKYFNLFSNILVTKGAKRILISDLQRNSSELYPLEFHEIIKQLKNKSVENILKNYDTESISFVQEYINLLVEKEYGFITEGDWDRNFPSLNYHFHEPNEVSNIFIEISSLSVLNKIKQEVENLGVKHLVIYSHQKLLLKDFQNIDSKFKNSVLNGIEIISPFHDDIDRNFIDSLHQTVDRIYNLVFHTCSKIPFRSKDIFRFTVQFIRQDLQISACGKVDLKYFNTNLPKVLEALNHNSCLYKKIGIDKDGNIKNCPLMSESYGNIQNTSLEEAIAQPAFRQYWNMNKDRIEGCKDCEFRYICTDCRAYTERSHYTSENLDISKPLKCGYNPYTSEWEEWSKNPLKQKAVTHYKI
ncbi:grasp-with-spasm system SPASM domain peptide maturase [Chryseobacterium sp.]|uniref:grasp-with-spasm system SPASM domain peptide maturase n=1 Tax=Chryseobacterium sp. TaxID=1871047 RepID=UPI0025C475F1|nr:grasp-with-spasm system SPASM domain peptide maturase [Chryseobacterium sp.]MBV8326250.1 grasp-with-spasm system SPASM domain peptide maturase [Chryseobacterium sp.]